MLRNFEKFEVGHYYVYTGNERKPDWASNGQMDIVLKHNIMKCIKVDNCHKTYANFEGYGEGVSDSIWSWEDGFDNWVEVESPDAVFKVGDSVLEYNKHYKHWQEVVIHVCNLIVNKNVNSYDNGSVVHYICKRKPKEKGDKISMSFDYMNERLKCPHCGKGKDTRIHYVIYLESTGKNYKDKCIHCGKQYRYDRASQQLKLISDEHIEGVVDNPFKKYIRKKKYLTFSKKK